jgi:hypothetical protein
MYDAIAAAVVVGGVGTSFMDKTSRANFSLDGMLLLSMTESPSVHP